MDKELIYRLIFTLALIIGFGISGYYRRRADRRGGDEISLEDEGPLLPWIRRLLGIAMLGSALTYIVRPRLLAWATLDVPDGLRIAAAVYALIAAPTVFYWIFSSLGGNVTPTVVTRKASTLIEHGPYRWIRQPLYTFGLLSWVLMTVYTQVWVFAVVGVAAFLMIAYRTPIEERKLIEKHGDAYRDYVRRTGRYLPRITPSA
jgi:protein-S-isoprenylcysteine O-methyltransferase Ste14